MIKKNPIITKKHNKKNLLEFIKKDSDIYREIDNYYNKINHEESFCKREIYKAEMNTKDFKKQRDDLEKLYDINFGCCDYGHEHCLDINGLKEVLRYLNIKI